MSSSDSLSRRRHLGAGRKVAFVEVAAGVAPEFIQLGRTYPTDALPPGMVPDSMGFEGCGIYQYGENTTEGRAIKEAEVVEADVPRSTKLLGDKFMANVR